MIKSVSERSTLTHCTSSINQLADWTKTPADHRKIPHLFTGLLVSLLLLSSLQRALWQRAVQSQIEETNPQRLATPTLMEDAPKNVISPISRLIKLCNRREFERIIWRGAVMYFFPLPPSLSFPDCFSQWKFFFFYHRTSCIKTWKQICFILEVVCSWWFQSFLGHEGISTPWLWVNHIMWAKFYCCNAKVPPKC